MPASIAEAEVRVRAALQAEAEDAVREIARFDAEITAIAERRAARVGDDAATELAPLAAVLLRTESASSSEIEGVTAGARALAMAVIEAKAGPNAQLVTANVTAMQRAVELADQISVEGSWPRTRHCSTTMPMPALEWCVTSRCGSAATR